MEQQGYLYLAGFFLVLLIEELGVPLPFVTSGTMVALGLQGRDVGLPLWSLLITASAASIVGSTILYVAGRKGVGPLLARYRRRLGSSDDNLARLETQVPQGGFWAILGARFLPGLTQASSLVAGTLRAPLPVLWSAVLVSSAAWALFWLSGAQLGYGILAPILGFLPPAAQLPVAVACVVLLMMPIVAAARRLAPRRGVGPEHEREQADAHEAEQADAGTERHATREQG